MVYIEQGILMNGLSGMSRDGISSCFYGYGE